MAAQTSSSPIETHALAPPTAVARYSAPATPNPPLVAQNAARSNAEVRTTGSTAGWSTAGGSPVVVAQGETAGGLAVRYGVPIDALLHANGLTSAAEVRPGARLVIPVYNAVSSHPQRLSEAAAPAEPKQRILPTRGLPPQRVAERAPAKETLHFVKGPQPVSHAPGRPVAEKEIQSAKDAKTGKTAEIKPAQSERQAKLAAKTEAASGQKIARVETPAAAEPKRQLPAQRQPAAVDTTATGSLPPAASALASAPVMAPAASSVASNAPEFRWPAHGRIIQAFKTGGNDGINIAVPEGTAVKAADDGVVAYAGDELKGYGKLVLIRHSNGFVSAYANNEDLDVKRGETVKRGQVIAKSGQTGNVASPQLHFELRKGSTPVDPTQYLAGL